MIIIIILSKYLILGVCSMLNLHLKLVSILSLNVRESGWENDRNNYNFMLWANASSDPINITQWNDNPQKWKLIWLNYCVDFSRIWAFCRKNKSCLNDFHFSRLFSAQSNSFHSKYEWMNQISDFPKFFFYFKKKKHI